MTTLFTFLFILSLNGYDNKAITVFQWLRLQVVNLHIISGK